ALPDELRARGAAVDVLHLYRTLREPVDREAVVASDLVTFTSSSTVENVLGALAPADLTAIRAVSIGPVTSGSLRAHGVEPLVEADPHDVEGLVAAGAREGRGAAVVALPSRRGGSGRGGAAGGGDRVRPQMSRPIVTFLSDFGSSDPFVGVCQGVIVRTCPEAEVIPLAHGIEPQSVGQGSRVLAASVPYLPVGVHMAVV